MKHSHDKKKKTCTYTAVFESLWTKYDETHFHETKLRRKKNDVKWGRCENKIKKSIENSLEKKKKNPIVMEHQQKRDDYRALRKNMQ